MNLDALAKLERLFEGRPIPSIEEASQLLLEKVRTFDVEATAILIEYGADVNVQDASGMTPLHHAAALGARPCIRLLVASGKCDFLARDRQGRYAFELAIEWARDHAVARLLMKKQAQQAATQGIPAYVPRES